MHLPHRYCHPLRITQGALRDSFHSAVPDCVCTCRLQGNNDRIGTIVNKLVKDYAFSAQANYRKGGLLCLAAAAVALAEQNQVGQL